MPINETVGVSCAPENNQGVDIWRLAASRHKYSFRPTFEFLAEVPELGLTNGVAAQAYLQHATALLNYYNPDSATGETAAGLAECMTLLDLKSSRIRAGQIIEHAATAGRRRWFDGVAADLFSYADQFYNFNGNCMFPELGPQPEDFRLMIPAYFSQWGFRSAQEAVSMMNTVKNLFDSPDFIDRTAYEINMASPRLVEHVNGTVTGYGQAEAKAAVFRYVYLRTILPEHGSESLTPMLGLPEVILHADKVLPVAQIGRHFTTWENSFARNTINGIYKTTELQQV